MCEYRPEANVCGTRKKPPSLPARGTRPLTEAWGVQHSVPQARACCLQLQAFFLSMAEPHPTERKHRIFFTQPPAANGPRCSPSRPGTRGRPAPITDVPARGDRWLPCGLSAEWGGLSHRPGYTDGPSFGEGPLKDTNGGRHRPRRAGLRRCEVRNGLAARCSSDSYPESSPCLSPSRTRPRKAAMCGTDERASPYRLQSSAGGRSLHRSRLLRRFR